MIKQWWARAVVGRTSVSDPLREPERPDARFEAEWRSIIKTRLVVILGILAFWAVSLEARLVWLQVVKHEDFANEAKAQQQDSVTIQAPRGDITDRNGQLLAYSVDSTDVWANPSRVKDAAREAAELCQALGDCSKSELTDVTGKLGLPKKLVLIRSAREMSPDASNGVRALIGERAKAARNAKVDADRKDKERIWSSIWVEPRSWRYYPKMDLAAQLVGYVRADGNGGAGVESSLNARVSGKNGRMLIQVDGRPEEMFTRIERAPKPGDSVELTIDVMLQHILERELAAGVQAAGALTGSAIIMDPMTGEVLAQASYPSYNPNLLLSETSEEGRKNRAVQDIYEPGSTLKIVTASAALNDGVFAPSQLIDTNPGRITIPGRAKAIDEDKGRNYGVLSFQDVLVHSSNVGAVQIGRRVGDRRLLDYLHAFGFGQRIAPSFPGESPGRLTTKTDLTESTLASLSMGYEIGVTPIQMAAAASVVANGGFFVEPHIIRAEIHEGRRTEVAPKVLRRVIDPTTALTLTGIMEDVVSSPQGTGNAAALARYQVAGKTGTAKKAIPGGYSNRDYNVSFVGFVPSRRPVFTILVVVDSPHKMPAYGGKVAAPIFRRIAAAALEYAGVTPTISPAPPVIMAADRRLLPFTPPIAPPADPVITKIGDRPVMPDLTGMSVRDVVRVTNALGLPMTSEGDGFVVSQSPSPGAILDASSRGTFQFRRGPIPPARSDR